MVHMDANLYGYTDYGSYGLTIRMNHTDCQLVVLIFFLNFNLLGNFLVHLIYLQNLIIKQI